MTRYVLYACVFLAGTLAAAQVTATEPAEPDLGAEADAKKVLAMS